MCDLTLLQSITYRAYNNSYYSRVSAFAESAGCRRRKRPQTPPFNDCSPEPFLENTGRCVASVAKTSCAKIFRSSLTSVSSHLVLANTHAVAAASANVVPRNTIRRRGGNDLLSGTWAASNTFTVGISSTS